MNYDIHPAAELFPLLNGEAFDALVADIKANGLIEPIVVTGNTILDGRNRLRACEAAGIDPRYREIDPANPVAYIASTNVHRRHLTIAQRAAIAADLATMAEGRPKKTGPNGPVSSELSNEQAAQLMGVSPRSVKRAKKLKTENPQAHEAIKCGDKAAVKAAKAKDKPAPKSAATQEDDDMSGSMNRKYLYLKSVAIKAYIFSTGEAYSNSWAGENLVPALIERAEWLREFTGRGQKELSEEQAEEVTRLTIEYIHERWPEKIAARANSPADIATLQAAADEARAALTDKEQTRLDRAIATAKRIMEMQFEDRIKEHLADVLRMYNEEYERYKAISDSFNGIFTSDEYKLLISCLHPDRVPQDQAKRYERVFHLIKAKEQILVKKPQSDKLTTMPKTVDELLSRRVKH